MGGGLPFIKGELSSGAVFHRCGIGVLKNVRFRFRQRSSGAGILQSPGVRAKIGELKNYPFNGMDRRITCATVFETTQGGPGAAGSLGTGIGFGISGAAGPGMAGLCGLPHPGTALLPDAGDGRTAGHRLLPAAGRGHSRTHPHRPSAGTGAGAALLLHRHAHHQ